MKGRKLIFFISLFLLTFQLFAQDTIRLMNGKHLVANVIKIDDQFLHYRKHLTTDTGNIITIERAEVYSVVYHNGQQNILYKKDTANGYYFTAEQMNQYVLGEKDAYPYRTNFMLSVAGLAAGATAAYYIRFWGLPIVPVYSVFLGIIDPKIKSKKVSNPGLIGTKYYNRGYHSVTTRKRVIVGIASSLIGFVTMYVVAPHIK
jgi:hypothetical protein